MNHNNTLLDLIKGMYGLRTDSQLAKLLGYNSRLSITQLRCSVKFGASHILRAHEKTGMPVSEIRAVLRDGVSHTNNH